MTAEYSSSSRRLLAAALVSGLFSFPLLLGTSGAAHAAETKSAIDCDTTDVDAELLTCAKNDLTTGQKRMDQLVKQTMAALPVAARPVFEASQKSWTAYRDADCKWNAYDIDSGKTSDLILMNCLADLTISRMEELDAGVNAQ